MQKSLILKVPDHWCLDIWVQASIQGSKVSQILPDLGNQNISIQLFG